MNIYNTIKAAVTTRQAAEYFGLAVDKHGMAVCPFHDDHQPSLKLDQRYYCRWTAQCQGNHRQQEEADSVAG